ncbi:hypothetical protein E1B28_011482 [Marasmius oreades]|uniref:Uncharacterized protein n=1 Tax=Marasmius oreades TaxID=181124 RepID=A0A9P7UR85_9AGAR|nr:uncharacterized protein E1B28_011482 [Marasmius oreades]KAG7089836.1 hypothetical protein E1B28_011482 [Marasmius oreades]
MPSPNNCDSVGNLKEQLFLYKCEIATLRSQNTLLRSQLSSMEKNANQLWNDLFDGARKTSFFKREATALAMKVRFLEQLLSNAVDSGPSLNRDILERSARELHDELEQGGLEDEDIVAGLDSQPKSNVCNDKASLKPSQSTNIRPYVPSFLKPIAIATTTIEAIGRNRPVQNNCSLSHPDDTCFSDGPTAEQIKALLSFKRLIAPLSTDLGSLETSSVGSLSIYSRESSDMSDSYGSVPAKDADATLVEVSPSQLCKSSTTFPENMVPSINPKSRIPVNILKHSRKSLTSLNFPQTCSPSKPKLSRPTASTTLSSAPVTQEKDRTSITRQRPSSRLAKTKTATPPLHPNSFKRSQRPKSPSAGRNLRATRTGAIQANRIPSTTTPQSRRG